MSSRARGHLGPRWHQGRARPLPASERHSGSIHSEGHFPGVRPSPGFSQKLLDLKGLWARSRTFPNARITLCVSGPAGSACCGPDSLSRTSAQGFAMLLTWVLLPPVSEARNLGQGVSSPEWGETPRQQHPSLLGYQNARRKPPGVSVRVKSALKWKLKRARDYRSEKWPRNGDSGTQDFSAPFPPARRLGWAPVPRTTPACVPGREGQGQHPCYVCKGASTFGFPFPA